MKPPNRIFTVLAYIVLVVASAIFFPPRSLESLVRTISLLVTVEGILLGLLPLMLERGVDPNRISLNLLWTLASLLISVTTIIQGENMELPIGPSPVNPGLLFQFDLSVLLFGIMTAAYAYTMLSLTLKVSKEKTT